MTAARYEDVLREIAESRCETGWGDPGLKDPPSCSCNVCKARRAVRDMTGARPTPRPEPASLFPSQDRKRLYIIEETVTERFYYDPEEIKRDFGEAWDAFDGTFEDFLVGIFEEHNGSIFHGRYFHDDANPSVGVDLVERWDDE